MKYAYVPKDPNSGLNPVYTDMRGTALDEERFGERQRQKTDEYIRGSKALGKDVQLISGTNKYFDKSTKTLKSLNMTGYRQTSKKL